MRINNELDNAIVVAKNISKVYPLYSKPTDRLKEAIHPFRKKYHKDKRVLDDISMELYKGDVIGILGRNGAGKSTLLKILTGIINPSFGSYEINGTVASLLELGAGFDFELTGIENIYLNSALNGIAKPEVELKIQDIITFADIGEYLYQPVKNYSSGMFARLAFATVVHFIPDVLIIDEALSVGDVFFQQKCNAFIKKHLKETTVILVTHDMHTVSKMANKVMVIDQGHVAYYGDVLEGVEYYTKLGQGSSSSTLSNVTEHSKNISSSTIHNEKMTIIEEDKISGSLAIIIRSFSFFVNDKISSAHITPNDKVTVRLELINNSNTQDNPIVGYLVSDRQGYHVFGHNTISSGFDFNVNKRNIVEFSFLWPEITDNSYFITLGIGLGEDAFVHEVSCWAHNLFKLDSLSGNKEIHCLFNNEIETFDIYEG